MNTTRNYHLDCGNLDKKDNHVCTHLQVNNNHKFQDIYTPLYEPKEAVLFLEEIELKVHLYCIWIRYNLAREMPIEREMQGETDQ